MFEFVRLRSFLVIHRVFAIVFVFFGGVRVCSTLSQFDRLRISPFFPGEPGSVSSRTFRSLQSCYQRGQREIRCHSLFEFDRLRSFLVFHRVFAIVFVFSGGVRVCSTLSQFDRLRISPFFPGEPDSIRSRTIRSLQFCCKRPPINSVSKFTRLRATSTIPRNS